MQVVLYTCRQACWQSKSTSAMRLFPTLRHAIALGPAQPEAYYLLGRAYEAMGNKAEAHKQFAIHITCRKASWTNWPPNAAPGRTSRAMILLQLEGYHEDRFDDAGESLWQKGRSFLFLTVPWRAKSFIVRRAKGDVVQLVRMLPCHGRGRGFEPRRPRHRF